MLMKTRDEESGIILIGFLFMIVLVLLGYVVVNSISKSREADQVRESASDVIDAAQNAAETVNGVRNDTQNLLNGQ